MRTKTDTFLKLVKEEFERDRFIYWFHLSRFSYMMIILNISLFFLTELVTKHGYYYTFYSLFFLCLVEVGLLFPSGMLNRIGYYMIFVVLDLVAAYFLVASIVYWIKNSAL